MGNIACQTEPNILDTTDIDLTTCAVLNGHALINSYIGKRNRVVFCFKHTKNLDKLVEQFIRGEVLVEPTSFLKVYRLMKNQIFKLREGG